MAGTPHERHRHLLAALLALLLASPMARTQGVVGVARFVGQADAEQSVPAATWNRDEAWIDQDGLASPKTIGWSFRPVQAVNVTALGAYDDEQPINEVGGFAEARQIALWDGSGTLLVRKTIPAGEGGTLCQDGYRYVSIAPITLQAGTIYSVGALYPASGEDFDVFPNLHHSGPVPIAFDQRLDFLTSSEFTGPVLTCPDSFTPGPKSWVGAVNMRLDGGVCEPNPEVDLVTSFGGENGQAGNMFDLVALPYGGLTVDSWQIHLGDAPTNDTPITVTIWWRMGSYVGHDKSAAGWQLLGSVDVLSWGNHHPTPVPLGGLNLPRGEPVGVFITNDFITGGSGDVPELRYSNIGPVPGTVGNELVEVRGGVGKANPPFAGTTILNRMWNGGVALSSPPPWMDLGYGLAGALGTPELGGIGSLGAGEPFSVVMSGALPLQPAWLVVGGSKVLQPFAGGTIVPATDEAFALFVNELGSLSFSAVWPGWLPPGFEIFWQCWALDPTGPLGWSASNALVATVP